MENMCEVKLSRLKNLWALPTLRPRRGPTQAWCRIQGRAKSEISNAGIAIIIDQDVCLVNEGCQREKGQLKL